jgi:L-iditol 2-dehydrogenase
MCLTGATVFGANGNGAHARYMKVPVATLVPLPDALSFETGAAISCGTGTAYQALSASIWLAARRSRSSGRGRSVCRRTQLAVAMGATRHRARCFRPREPSSRARSARTR